MKTLKQILNTQQVKRQPIPLFSRLKQIKLHHMQPTTISRIKISKEDTLNTKGSEHSSLQQIEKRLQQFKHQKALDVLNRHLLTQESIQHIVNSQKSQYQYQALCLIDQKYKRSVERNCKSPQEAGSTLPNSDDRNTDNQTPGFDLPQSKYKSSKRSTQLSQFTLGQKGGKDSSSCSTKTYRQDDSFVSQFQVKERETASQKIKNKIMNPQRPQTDARY